MDRLFSNSGKGGALATLKKIYNPFFYWKGFTPLSVAQ